MTEFKYQDKLAMIRILIDIMNADGRIDARELSLLKTLSKEFEIESVSKSDIDNKLSILALLDIKNFDDKQKSYFADLMNQMIEVDEDIDANEIAILEVVCEFCNIHREINN